MRLTPRINPRGARALRAALACALCLPPLAACSLDGASKKEPRARTPAGAQAPPTALPMPPLESAHATAARAGGWTTLDGRRGDLPGHRGEVVVLDFYATYCPPCVEAVPHLVELQRRHGPEGLRVIGLNVGGREDQAKVPEFVRRFRIQYELANPDDATTDVFLAGDTVIPQTLVFDRRGRLVEHFTGYDSRIARRLDEAVRAALDTKAD